MTSKTAPGVALIETPPADIKATRKFPHPLMSFETSGGQAGRDIITQLLTPPGK